jgi:hypothetical protein
VLLHYHYLTEPELHADLMAALARVGCPAQVTAWLERRLAEL